MKTSNKILLILLANLILIPAALMLALSAKVKSGNYVLGMTEYEKEARAAKPITNTGFLKLLAPEGTKLACTIYYSDSIYYRKHGSASNQLSVENSGDTLVFSIPSDRKQLPDNDQAEVYLDLFMPFNGLLMLDGAEARLDSVATDARLTIAMENNSTLTLKNEDRDTIFPLKFASLFVQGNNSDINIEGRTSIDKIALQLSGNSALHLGEEISFTSLEGSISGETSVLGPAKWIYQLKQLP
jgi:hypothetical protein